MSKVFEKQLSWLAIIVTALYSLASCRGDDCGHDDLSACANPIRKITNTNDFGTITTKQELEQLCGEMEAGLKCIKTYSLRCLNPKKREPFTLLYKEVNMAILELCHPGPYQDAFLKHAPCIQKVKADYELCYERHQGVIRAIEAKNQTEGDPNEIVKSVCCAFQEYMDCVHHSVRKQCGEEAGSFFKEFFDRMSITLIKTHCQKYPRSQCLPGSGSSRVEGPMIVVPLVVVILTRYFT
ncbi:uncharacterized protein LOC105699939 isoform X2 [Orussus abietinus]|uniref:uncharacterized protein LOC105699939 isoform X2 n=1 Tax=Orussus abietinus TaxID=222816 RepID=UPI000C7160DA|nr:uncharacterized protein LOC105699939 isoform X2 [Orussus abietinus]